MEAVFDEFRLLKAPSRMNAITRGNEILAGCSVRSEHWRSGFCQWNAFELRAVVAVKQVSSQNTSSIGCSRNGGYHRTLTQYFLGKSSFRCGDNVFRSLTDEVWGYELYTSDPVAGFVNCVVNHITVQLSNRMEKNPWESNCRSASQEIPHILWIFKDFCPIYRSLPLICSLIQMKPVCSAPYSFTIGSGTIMVFEAKDFLATRGTPSLQIGLCWIMLVLTVKWCFEDIS